MSVFPGQRRVARVGDRTTGVCAHPQHAPNPITIGGKVITGSSRTRAEVSIPVARIGDTVESDCGHTGTIITGSSRTTADQRRVAREGDAFSGVYTGTIIQGSPRTTIV